MKHRFFNRSLILLCVLAGLIIVGCGDKKPETSFRGDTIRDLSEADYDKLLSSKSIKFDSGVNATAGPVAFRLSRMLGKVTSRNGRPVDEPFIEINVRAISLPNLAIGDKELATMIIEHIWGQDGRDVLNSDYSAAKDLSFSYEENPFPHLSSGASFILNSGITLDDIKRIEGKFIFKLPVGVKALSFDSTKDKGKNVDIGDTKIQLISAGENNVRIQYEGSFDNQIGVLALNDSGDRLLDAGMGGGRVGSHADYFYQFEGRIKTIQVVIASGFIERQYAFVIEK